MPSTVARGYLAQMALDLTIGSQKRESCGLTGEMDCTALRHTHRQCPKGGRNQARAGGIRRALLVISLHNLHACFASPCNRQRWVSAGRQDQVILNNFVDKPLCTEKQAMVRLAQHLPSNVANLNLPLPDVG